MDLLKEIESNFLGLETCSISHKQSNFIVQFIHNEHRYEIIIDKELEYIYVKSPTVNTDIINTSLVQKRNISNILKIINENSSEPKSKVINNVNEDSYGLFRCREVFNKGNCNYDELRIKLLSSVTNSGISIRSIPKELLYNKRQIVEILINEIKKVNSNKEHMHYITPTDEDYKFHMFINTCGNDGNNFYVKLLLTVDPELHPYYPPSIRYLEPNASRSFIYNMSNLELLKIENWNPVINMDWLITNISESIKPLIQEYVIDSVDGEITQMDKEIVEFSSIIGERLYKNISIDLKHAKFSLKNTGSSSTNNKYWNSGVGYGYSGRTDWDISKYVKEQENKNELIVESINKIIDIFNKEENSLSKLVNSTILNYLENNICRSTLLEINKKVKLFEKCMELTQIIFQNKDERLINWKLSINKGFE